MSEHELEIDQSKKKDSITSHTITSSLYNNSQVSENFEVESNVSLNNQVSLVLKDYEKNFDSSSSDTKLEESSTYFSSSDEDHIDQRLKHIEESAKKGLSKYFEKNVLKFKIKLTFDEPVYLTNEKYMDGFSTQDSEPDMISINTESFSEANEATETSVTYELEEDDKSTDQENTSISSIQGSNQDCFSSELNNTIKHIELNDKLSMCIKPENSDLKSSKNEIFNKLSDLVDLFINDDVEEDIQVEYEQVEITEEVTNDSYAISQSQIKKESPASKGAKENLDDPNQILNIINVAFESDELDLSSKELKFEHRNLNIENFQHLNDERKSVNLKSLKTENFQHLSNGHTNILDLDEQDIQVEYKNLHIASKTIEDTFLQTKKKVLAEKSEVSSGSLNYLSRSIDYFIHDQPDIEDSPHTESSEIDYPVKECSNFQLKKSANVIKTGTDNDIEYLRKLSEIVDSFTNEKA